jgi:hypothetical protein
MKWAWTVIQEVSQEIAPQMVPIADLVPTGGVTLNGLAVAAGTTSQNITLTYPTDGILLAIRGSTRDGAAASLAGMLLRVQIDGRTDMWSSGANNGAGFLSLAQLSGQNSTFGRYPVLVPFQQATTWTVYLENTTGGDLVVDLDFDIKDLRNPRGLQ